MRAGEGGLTDQCLPQRETRFRPAFTRALDPGYPNGAVSWLLSLTRHVTKEAAFVQQAKKLPATDQRELALSRFAGCADGLPGAPEAACWAEGGSRRDGGRYPLRPWCGAIPGSSSSPSRSLAFTSASGARPGGLSPAPLSLGRAVQGGGGL